MECDHAVKEEIVLPLGNDFGLPIFGNKDWKLFEMSPNKIPDTFFCAGRKFEALFKSSIWLVG